MNCKESRDLMSEYLDGDLSESRLEYFRAHLSGCESCRKDLSELEASLKVLHDLPRQEPVLDMWPEFALRFAEIRTEAGLGPFVCVRLHSRHLLSALKDGWQIFFTVVRYNLNGNPERNPG